MTEPHVDVHAVLYTDDLEPITVLDLPSHVRAYIESQGRVRIPILEPVSTVASDGLPFNKTFKAVDIWAERFVRNGRSHLMLFTHNDENALLLRAAFLPGQLREVRDRKAEAFGRGFLAVLMKLGSAD